MRIFGHDFQREPAQTISNIEINNTVSMNKLTKNAVMRHLLAVFLPYCLLLGWFVSFFFISI